MVATVEVRWDYGGTDNSPGTIDETVTNLRYKEADNNTQDLNNPVTIPAAGTKHSYWKQLFLEATAGTFTQIDNVNLWVASFDWTGVTLNIGNELPVHSSTATTGYDVADGLNALTVHTDITGVTNHGATHIASGSAKNITISEAGGVIDAIGETTNYWVTAIEVASTAVAGTQTAKTENVEYDEI